MDKKVKYAQRKGYNSHGDNLQQSAEPTRKPWIWRLKILIVYVYIPVAVLLCVVVLTSLLTNIPLGLFCRDPAAILEEQSAAITPLFGFKINPFIGIISNLGVLLWCVSASTYLFVFMLEKALKGQKQREKSSFLLLMGLFSLVLLLDDLFLFHEVIAPKLVVHEEIVYAAYIAIFIYLAIKFKNVFLNTEIVALCLAFFFFFLSLSIDFFHFPSIILEDGFKLLGIASWASYSVIVSLQFALDFGNSNPERYKLEN